MAKTDPTGYLSIPPDLIRGSTWKTRVACATTANITLSGTQTIDGHAVIAGERVLVKNQTTGSQNGILVCASGAWTRAYDFDQDLTTAVPAEETLAAMVVVVAGTVNGGTVWRCTNTSAPTIGTTSLTFTQFGAASSLPWYNVKTDGTCVGDGVTDDTVALQAAITAATASGTQSATLYFPPGTYLIGGALQDTGAFNGQLLLPNVSTLNPEITITFMGAARPPFSFHGSLANPAGYSIIRSTLAGASGTAALISGGNSGQNNVQVVVRNIITDLPNNPTLSGWNLSTTQGGNRDGLFITVRGLWTLAFTQPSNTNAYGIKLPQTNNSDLNQEDSIMVVGTYTGILHGELVIGNYITSLCMVGVEVPFMYHPGGYFRTVQTSTPRGVKFTGGANYLDFWYDAEHCNVGAGGPINPAWAVQVYDVDDASNYWHGHCRWFGVQAGVGPDHSFIVNGATNGLYEEIGAAPAGSASFATPAIVFGTAAAAGSASTAIRSDSTIVAFDATVPVTQAFGDAAATGSVAAAARRDHVHGMPASSAHYLVIATSHSTPLIFGDLVQTTAGDDLIYTS